MTLLREIQADAVNPNIDLPTLLRKCKILATRLKNEAFKHWIENELDGYKDKEELPTYRILYVQSYGHFSGPFGSGLKNAAIPPRCLPKELRELATKAYIDQGVGCLFALVNGKKSGELTSVWPADAVVAYGGEIYQDMNCLGAWRVIGLSQMAGILETIRNRVLTFALEIESEAPDSAEQEVGFNTLPKERVSQLYQTVILGNVGNVSSGGNNTSQTATVQVLQNDFKSLQKYLSDAGISEKDIGDLKEAVKTDPRPKSSQAFGKKVSAWTGKMISKAASGVWKVSTTIAADIISKALLNYYGLK